VCLHGETGLLVRVGEVNALADGVIRLLQDATMADRMGARGRELVKEQFSEARMVQQLDELYRRLWAGRH
jgi:glycosyltransferase involved in cell wall biosynthesis